MVWIGLHGVMFLFLFSDFYKQSYNKKQKRLKDLSDKAAKSVTLNGKPNEHVGKEDDSACMVSNDFHK